MVRLLTSNAGLLASYPMDEASGTALLDTTGTNAPGTLVGATRAASHSAGGLAFGGTGYAALGVVALPAPNAPQSLSWWQNAPAVSATQSVIPLTNDAANAGLGIGFRAGRVGAWKAGGTYLVSAVPPSSGAWHHYAYTFDGTTHRLYIDGAQADSSQVAPDAAAPTALNLGRWTGGQEYYTGQLDDLRIYGRALTAAEVLALANDQIPPAATGTPTSTPTNSPTSTGTATSSPTSTTTATATATATPAAPPPVTMRLHYTYDDANRRIGLALPDGQQQVWGYDPAGRVNGVIQPGGGSWIVAHNGAGQPTMAGVPSGGSQVWGYDTAGRAVSATWLQAGSPAFSQVATLDPAGQRKQLADSWGTVTYGYDRAGRLTSAAYPDGSTEADSYDPAGNRTAITATTPLSGTVVTTNSYDAADQLSTAATTGGPQPGTTSYGYDGNGNQTGSSGPAGTTSNTFNDLNQLTHITGPGTNLTLLYDGQGDRLRSYERGTPTWTLRNEAQDLAGGLSALVSDGTADYAYLSPGDGSAPLSSYTPGTARATYLATDLLGSVRLATDPAGATIGAGAYDAWGVARPYTGTSGATQLAGLQGVAPFGYAGQQRDAGPGTYAMRVRRYDPATGRFQSQDRAPYQYTVPTSINPYAYALDSPARFIDPSGLIPEDRYICASKDFNTGEVIRDIDNVIQGHDFAESAWLRHLGSNPNASCEFTIPFGSRTAGSSRGDWDTFQGPRDGRADLVEDYRGNGSNLYEFEPLGAFVNAKGSSWNWKKNPMRLLAKKQGEAAHYIEVAGMWQNVGSCNRRRIEEYPSRRRVRADGVPSSDAPPGREETDTWTGPREFSLGAASPYPILSYPVFRVNPRAGGGKGTWYMVADSAVLDGLIVFRVFKKDMDGNEQPEAQNALDFVPANVAQLNKYWVGKLGGKWQPGERYGWLRPQASCGSGACNWAWYEDGTFLRWVAISATSAAVGVLAVTAVGACIGSVVCGAAVALGSAVVLSTASSPNFADAQADHAMLVRKLVSGPDGAGRTRPVA